MKRILIIFVVLAVLAGGLIFAFKQMSGEREMEKVAEAPVTAESRLGRTDDGSVRITLDAAMQKRIDLGTALPAPGVLEREIKAYGRVLDPASLAAIWGEWTVAAAALETSSKELQRVKMLAQEQNASARALEAAQASVKRDQTALDILKLKAAAAWGKTIMGRADLAALVQSLTSAEAALIRLDLPAGEAAVSPKGARLYAISDSEKMIPAEYLSPAVEVDGQAQGLGFLFLARGAEGFLRSGQAVIGFIRQPGEPLRGVIVPASAVIRTGGKTWAYLQSGETNFVRRDFSLDHPTEGGWLVTNQLSAQDRIVVRGAQMLLSEELKSRIQFGD